jgi:type III secretion protein L
MGKLFALLSNEELHLTEGQKIVHKDDFTTLALAQQIEQKAKENADNLLQETEKKCEELKEAAQKEGFQKGLEQLSENILGLDQEKKRLLHEMNKLILPLALKVAKKIVAKELETHPDTIVEIVMQALSAVLHNHRVTIWVSKADKEIVDAHKARLKEKLDQVESLSIKERGDITPGGCIIESETGVVNAELENQFRAIEATLDKHLAP